MLPKRRFFLFAIYALLLMTIAPAPTVFAQDGRESPSVTNTCPALVEEALAALDDNCAEMGRNEACYGYRRVDSTFDFEVTEDFFAAPSDRAALEELRNIRTAGLNLETGQWGIAVLNIQANIPNTLPGQAVTFLLLGDVEVENAVTPSAPFDDPVIVVTTARINVRSGPGTDQTVLGFADQISELEATGINEDGTWLRINFEGSEGWISRNFVSEVPEIETLPIAEAVPPSPMQAFFFSTSTNEPECVEAPDVVAVRSRSSITVDLNVNGADISLGSLILLRQISDTEFTITVEDGHVETADGTIVRAGETIVGTYNPEDNTFVEWVEVREATPEELEIGDIADEAFEVIGLPEFNAPPVPPTAVPGDTTIPGTTTGASCAGFRPTSPLNGLNNGGQTFYWDAAAGATDYRLTATNLDSGQSSSTTVAAPQTNAFLNLSERFLGPGFNFNWQVVALRNGTVVCSSDVLSMQRGAAPPEQELDMNVTAGCFDEYDFRVSYSGFIDRESIFVTFLDEAGASQVGTGTGPEGTLTFFVGQANGVEVVSTASGFSTQFGNFNCGG